METADDPFFHVNDRSFTGRSIDLGYHDDRADQEPKRHHHHHSPAGKLRLPLEETNRVTSPAHQGLLIGSLDQFSLGDLLMPHVVSRLLHLNRLRCAGLVNSDFTSIGGHTVLNYGESAIEMIGKDLRLIHVGGETLSQDLTSGYAMASRGEEAERFSSLLQIGDPTALRHFVRRRTGQVDDFAYLLAGTGQFHGSRSCFHAVGLSEPETLSDSMRTRLIEILKEADFVGIRDKSGASFLENQGVQVERMPCGLTALDLACPRRLREALDSAAMTEVKQHYPNGWIAVETSRIPGSGFDRMVAALGSVAEKERVGLVFFRASHRVDPSDQSPPNNKWAEAFRENKAMDFSTQNIWELSSLITHSRLYCGSSLHSRVIAMSAGIPRINLPVGLKSVRSYCDLWEHDAVQVELSKEGSDWAMQLRAAMKVNPFVLQQHTLNLQRHYFLALEKLCQKTGLTARFILSENGDEMTSRPEIQVTENGFPKRELVVERRRQASQANAYRALNRNSSPLTLLGKAIHRIFGKVEM